MVYFPNPASGVWPARLRPTMHAPRLKGLARQTSMHPVPMLREEGWARDYTNACAYVAGACKNFKIKCGGVISLFLLCMYTRSI